MIDSNLFFTWKGEESREYNLVITNMNPVSGFERQVKKQEILGREGFVTIDYEAAYGDTYQVECFVGDEDYNSDEIKNWLSGSDKLSISLQPDRYYKASVNSKIEITKYTDPIRGFIVTFDIQPYGYLYEQTDEPIVITKSGTKIYNPGNYKSAPKVKVYGSGAVNLYFNDKVLIFKEIDTYIEFDTELDEVFKDTTPMEDKAVGETLFLLQGDNEIKWSGTGSITKVEIIPRWRCR